MTAEKRAPTTTSVETALESLQPIRDLAKNWDIDIAACLEEYLQDLLGDLTEEERKNLPKRVETLNFSQAALVLQNSSNVYSRKVEYLYNLVLQVHEELVANSGTKKGSSGNGNTRKLAIDAQIEEFNTFDQNVDFLLLDDVLPTDEKGNKINLQDANESGSVRDFQASLVTTGSRLSLGATLAGASRLDKSVATAASQSTHNLISGSQDAGTLRLIDGRCDVGADGILILPGAGGGYEGKIPRSFSFGNFSARVTLIAEQQAQPAQGPIAFGTGGNFDHDYPADPISDGNPYSESNDESQASPKRGIPTRPSKSANSDDKETPWAPLNPHLQEASSLNTRPLRVGKTYRLPPAVLVPPSHCVTGARTKRNKQIMANPPMCRRRSRQKRNSLALTTFNAKLSWQRISNKSGTATKDSEVFNDAYDAWSDMPELPLFGLAYRDEFLQIARAVAKQKNEIGREMIKKANGVGTEAVRHRNFQDGDDVYVAIGLGGSDGGSTGDKEDFCFGDEVDYGDMGNSRFFRMEDDSPPLRNENGGVDFEGKTFEELCRAHIQAFARGAEAYTTETLLSKRVGDWHERLTPVLEDEENRPTFDIFDYSKRVVSAIQLNNENDEGKPMAPFEVVAQNCPRYEVCRLFLASLSLSNSGNVQLHGGKESKLRLELMDHLIERPMENYIAPSQM